MTPNPEIYRAVEAIARAIRPAAEGEGLERGNEIRQMVGMPAVSAWRTLSKGEFARATAAFLDSPCAAMGEAFDSRLRLARIAAELGFAESLQALVSSGAAPWRDADGSVLGAAAAHGHLACVELILPISDPAGADEHGFTPLHHCARGEPPSPEILAALLPLSDARARARKGETALMLAARRGCTESVKLLLPHSDPLAAAQGGITALMHAASGGHTTCVELLLPHSAPKAADGRGLTALMHAASSGCVQCVASLLPVSDPAAVNHRGWNALMLAADRPLSQPHFECGHALLPFVDPRARNNAGQDALVIALVQGGAKGIGGWGQLLAPAFAKEEAEILRAEMESAGASPSAGPKCAIASPKASDEVLAGLVGRLKAKRL